jgi:hypothetical protein
MDKQHPLAAIVSRQTFQSAKLRNCGFTTDTRTSLLQTQTPPLSTQTHYLVLGFSQ